MKKIPFLLLLVAAGCGKNPYFSDDEGGPRQGGGIGGHDDELSLPYAAGTKVRISVKDADADAVKGWKVVSADAAKLSVDKLTVEDGVLHADCTAHAEGDVRIRCLDGGGEEQRAATVTIRKPDRAKVYAHGPLRILGRDERHLDSAMVPEARVVAGGKGVYGVAYFRGTERVYGRGIAAPEAAADVKVENATTSGVVTNEYLFITPSKAGASDVKLKPGGVTVLTLPVTAVAENELAELQLREEMPEKREDNTQVWVLAAAKDKAGKEVHGVYVTWTLDGAAQTGKDDPKMTSGDLFRYEHKPGGAQAELVATRGGLKAQTKITAHRGWVSDTTYLGCSFGGSGRSGALLVAAALLLLALRRRSA